MIAIERIATPASARAVDNNIRKLYPLHSGSWIAHPEASRDETSFCDYVLDFELPEPATFTLDVSADQRFELSIDDTFAGMGPDRCDAEHWSFQTYRVSLPVGRHTIRAVVSYLAEGFPVAQISIEPAFLLFSDTSPVDINTGSAPWRARMRLGVTTAPTRIPAYHVVGPNYTIDGRAYFAEQPLVEPRTVSPAGFENTTGIIMPRWRLHPSRLPEQSHSVVRGGRVRAVGTWADEEAMRETDASVCAEWQALVDGSGRVSVEPQSRVVVLWDLDEYRTGWPRVTVSGGDGARITLLWAEACYTQHPSGGTFTGAKGHRDEIDGKFFVGYGDDFVADGGEHRTFQPPWWRAGRYVRIVVESGSTRVFIEDLHLIETRMPLENEGVFSCDDALTESIIPVAVRGIQMCAHETYMDCPYYEQLMYVGDTRLQLLTACVMSREDRLNQRALELFDWSRRETGFVLERYPSTPSQLSTTFSMIWILMVRDYALWRDDLAFVRARLTGMRSLLEEFRAFQGSMPLLAGLPGWSFMDWVPAWDTGNPPDGTNGVSASINLLFLNALLAAAHLEDELGIRAFATEYRSWATTLAANIRDTFWDSERSLFADDLGHTKWSEHAQCLALLSGSFPDLDQTCLSALITEPGLERATVYFSFYLLEVLARFGRGDLLLAHLEPWREMVEQGVRTPLEKPEPSRSDCHAWGSHPLFHLHASVAGIRPAAFGFSRVRIAPQPAGLTTIRSVVPHPAGTVELSMQRDGARWRVRAVLPPDVPGTLVWQGKEHALSGVSDLVLPAE